MAKIYDISQWNELAWFSTGGTRAKKLVQSPEGQLFYFKRSQYKEPTAIKPGKDFRYEFWSEIIAYNVGRFLGFNVLCYDIGHDGTNIGCISESMFDAEKQHFMEGIRFIQGAYPEYEPDNKEHRKLYTFQAIEGALSKFRLSGFCRNLVETIVFDAIIGNGDRHQENWGIIMDHSGIRKALDRLRTLSATQLNSLDMESLYDTGVAFAPIYDSGSSLGRELTEERIGALIESPLMMETYLKRGQAEIHWNEKKLSHFELVRELLNSDYKAIITNRLSSIFNCEYSDFIRGTLIDIDSKVPDSFSEYKIPESRKDFICKLIVSRIEILKQLIDA
ncbi:hypothetical protein [uncultured Chitinophaga sp.]|uniref:hypothetical protein n=1 Tax=uncultured Chitinophaga sp. TaxID=339340 RepID=UPI0025EFA525|nr:hypothetical protein [uncultured Chitinophaga sp.]